MNHSQVIHPERKVQEGESWHGLLSSLLDREQPRSCPVPRLAQQWGAAPPPTKMLLLSVPPPCDLLPGCSISLHLCKDVVKLSGPGVCLGCAYRLRCWTQRGGTGLRCWGTAAHVHGDVPRPCVFPTAVFMEQPLLPGWCLSQTCAAWKCGGVGPGYLCKWFIMKWCEQNGNWSHWDNFRTLSYPCVRFWVIWEVVFSTAYQLSVVWRNRN